MNSVFADSSFYIALVRPDDDHHRRGIEFDAQYTGSYMTSEFVLIELGNWLAAPHHRPVFIETCRVLRSNPRTTIIPATAEWVARGMKLYADRLDKHWSITDCISFAMMRHHGLSDALTADHHFAQAGFNPLLANASQ